MIDWPKITPLLDQKLDPANIRKPEGRHGPKGDWIEAWHAIGEANRIFGYGGWSYTITGLTKDVLDLGKNSKNEDMWSAYYTCIVRLIVGEVVREDVGFGSGYGKKAGDAIEGATKEAVTDALKRCLRTFGSQFGLALYDKHRNNVMSSVDLAVADIDGFMDIDSLAQFWKAFQHDHKALAADPAVIDAKERKKRELAGITDPI